MTTIAYRNGMLAADTRSSMNGIAVSVRSKIFTGNGFAFALSGDVALLEVLKRWLTAGADQLNRPVITYAGGEKPNMRAIVVGTTGKISVSVYDEDFMLIEEDPKSYLAIGSGDRLAYGAMAHGATAIQAVQAACVHDPGSGLPIDWIDPMAGVAGRINAIDY